MRKSILREYVEYLKDNPEGYWFKRKLFGWGWMPVRWQGWIVVLAFILFLVWMRFDVVPNSASTNEKLIKFFVKIGIAIAVLILVCYKTGERPKWTWGRVKN